jgi:hypothetical protein
MTTTIQLPLFAAQVSVWVPGPAACAVQMPSVRHHPHLDGGG